MTGISSRLPIESKNEIRTLCIEEFQRAEKFQRFLEDISFFPIELIQLVKTSFLTKRVIAGKIFQNNPNASYEEVWKRVAVQIKENEKALQPLKNEMSYTIPRRTHTVLLDY